MKRILTIACLAVGIAVGYSQGHINFDNRNTVFGTSTPSLTPGNSLPSNGHDNRLVYNTDNVTLLTGTNWVAQLFVAVGSGQAESSLAVISGDTYSTFRPSTTGVPGAWNQALNKPLNVAFNTVLTTQVRVWDGSLFGTYDQAFSQGGTTGHSVVWNYTVPDENGTGFNPASLNMYGLQSFTLQVPEPSTIALGVLGAASLLIVRRRKQ